MRAVGDDARPATPARCIQLLEFLGLAWDVNTPEKLPPRPGVTALRPEALTVAPRGQAAL